MTPTASTEAQPFSATLESLCRGQHLPSEQARALFGQVVAGALSETEMTALLVALKAKGEQPTEIAGAAAALRTAASPFERPDYAYGDSCGTGGDGAHTVNISTAVAFVAAEAGVPIAKHGNRSVSSQCGSADVLEALGVNLTPSAERSRQALDEVGVCFLFAPQYHAGLRHAMKVRRALKTRTIMNLLGPLVNPARPTLQVMGIYDPGLVEAAAQTLKLLGCEAALVVHGSGLDELALHGPSHCALLRAGEVTTMEVSPADMGVSEAPVSALVGGSPAENAEWLELVLQGRASEPQLNAVAINCGALLWLADKAVSLKDGTSMARETLASGRCIERLRQLAAISQQG